MPPPRRGTPSAPDRSGARRPAGGGGVRGRAGSAPSGSPPRALTIDAWYTLYYLSEAERRRLDARRRKIWTAPILRAGLSRRRALELLARRERWVRATEAGGRTPSVPEQVATLAAWVGGRWDGPEIAERLDRTLLAAEVRTAPGVVRAIRALDRAGIPLAVVSNVLNETGTVARTLLERVGLLPHFRAVLLSCEHPWAKPSPGLFRLAVRFLGERPDATVHIGDLAYDLRGAWAAGLGAWLYVGLHRFNGYLAGQATSAERRRAFPLRRWEDAVRALAPGPR